MRGLQSSVVLFLTSLLTSSAKDASLPGYDDAPNYVPSTVPSNEALSFGQHYAVLNLDLINALVSGVANTTAGMQFIANTARWIDTVHAQKPPPLSIFTRIYFSNARQPEIGPDSPFRKVGAMLGTSSDPETEIYPAFHVDEAAGDTVLQKTRYYAGAGNALQEILSTQKIDTVILSGIRTSGVILSTVYNLFDLDYNV